MGDLVFLFSTPFYYVFLETKVDFIIYKKRFVYYITDYEKIDILVNNAGIAFHPFEKTKDGFELHFVTNYLGKLDRYILILLILLLANRFKTLRMIFNTALNIVILLHFKSRFLN